ncbi:3-oxoacyl-ACP reductase FabG [Mycobacterium sp. NAZ190054]|uniref:3-oxoacyl-ACP reductase FabG n=1 Tax=Mycobacterium sp. NAZ190054 TaxID=1747766 RepID=UPI000792BF7B|nr:3-oxoacyl-ACP reductase FabG [Mycobacterium sp. NAZ190054]KWX58525.1 beta-ketoacyl-ACP reductase [Mycobacterium sp. NAZ190054]
MKPHAGKVAVVTGGAQGIGAATARRLSKSGAIVGVVDLDGARAQQVAESLETDAIGLQCDVRDRRQVDSVVDAIVDKYGHLDILINNAGITRDALVFKMSDDDWNDVIGTHLTGGFFFARAAQRHMVTQRYGRIVFLSSGSALGNRGQTNYSAAKAGVQGMTRTLAIELGPFGVTVNAVAPGFVDTEMTRAMVERTEQSWDDLVRSASERAAVRRIGQPDDIANAIAFLASDEASFITGQTLYVTGRPTV